ncbi:MAG: hypothetical protein ACKVT2_17910 [Saprospiraceae bacterium]
MDKRTFFSNAIILIATQYSSNYLLTKWCQIITAMFPGMIFQLGLMGLAEWKGSLYPMLDLLQQATDLSWSTGIEGSGYNHRHFKDGIRTTSGIIGALIGSSDFCDAPLRTINFCLTFKR